MNHPIPISPPEEAAAQAGASPQPPAGGVWSAGTALYAAAIFVSAFLLFQVQPLIAKFVLPWFGGTPAVWTSCMLFFQVLLFGGYAYAHLTSSRLTLRLQGVVHVILLVAACGLFSIVPSAPSAAQAESQPVLRIVLLLAGAVGLPFFVLSATGPLLQSWFSRTKPGLSPYRLYALSNAGSLLALVSFPLVFDWSFTTSALARLWSWSFVVFAALCGLCAVNVARSRVALPALSEPAAVPAPAPSWGTRALWFALAMVPSVLLLATTNQVCLDVASVPFLWVLPLTLYLLTFILCFDGEHWYSRRTMMPVAALSIACLYPVLRDGATSNFGLQIVSYFTTFFLCAMVCHGELVRHKPPADYLTSFYLTIAAGGAMGGIFVGLVAPSMFTGFYELHVGLIACAALMLIVLATDRQSRFFAVRPRGVWLILFAAFGLLSAALLHDARQDRVALVDVSRNFYGVLRVFHGTAQYGDDEQPVLKLVNGRITHGFEYQSRELRDLPTTYYSPESAIGLVLSAPGKPRRVGLVGLGTGTLAAYARPDDRFRFYEINPAVERMAQTHFHYLEDCRGDVAIVPGDARLTLEREPSQQFDVLVLDAFSGDAIPVHLLTREAFEVYLKHMAAEGIIAVHISNRHFSLRPVVDAIADSLHLAAATIEAEETHHGGYSSTWVLVAQKQSVLQEGPLGPATMPPDSRRVLWTDSHASLLQVLWRRTFESLWRRTREKAVEAWKYATGQHDEPADEAES